MSWRWSLEVQHSGEALRVVWQRGLGWALVNVLLFVVSGFFFWGTPQVSLLGFLVWAAGGVLMPYYYGLRTEYRLERASGQFEVVTHYLVRRYTQRYPLSSVGQVVFSREYSSSSEGGETLMYGAVLHLRDGREVTLTDTSNSLCGKRELVQVLSKGFYEFQQNSASLETPARVRDPGDAALNQLEDLLARNAGRLPSELLERARWATDRLRNLLPHLPALEAAGLEGLDLRQTVLDYLSITLENYLVLPPSYAQIHLGPDQRTPRSRLLGRLGQLERGLWNLSVPLVQGDVQTARTRARLLEQTFRAPDIFS